MLLSAKIYAVGEAIGYNKTNVLVDNGELERVFRCQRYTTANLIDKL